MLQKHLHPLETLKTGCKEVIKLVILLLISHEDTTFLTAVHSSASALTGDEKMRLWWGILREICCDTPNLGGESRSFSPYARLYFPGQLHGAGSFDGCV